jgi:hypothetical protein
MTEKGGTKVPPFFLSYIRVGVPSEFGSLTAGGITYSDMEYGCSWTCVSQDFCVIRCGKVFVILLGYMDYIVLLCSVNQMVIHYVYKRTNTISIRKQSQVD